jgi:hypothetical protein
MRELKPSIGIMPHLTTKTYYYRDYYFLIQFNSSVGIAMGCGGGLPGFDSRQGQDFSLFIVSIPARGSNQPPIQWAPGKLSLGAKRPGHEINHSLPSSAVVIAGEAIFPLPHMSSWRGA